MFAKPKVSIEPCFTLKQTASRARSYLTGTLVCLTAFFSTTVFAETNEPQAVTDCATTKCFYVRPGASGGGTDWASALGALPATLVRGATYFLADGSYGSYTFDDPNSGSTTITVKKATDADHGTGTGWQASFGAGQAVFTHWSIVTDYYVFDGVRRDSNWQRGAVSQYGIKVAGTGPVRLDNGAGTGGDSLKFSYVDFQGGGRDTGRGDDVIYGLTGNSNITFDSCALHDSDRTIFLMRGNWTNLVVRRSYLARNTSTPATHGEMLSMTEGTNLEFGNNVIEDIEGTAVFAGLNNGTINGMKIYGNVVLHTAAYAADTGRKAGHNFGIAGFVFVANDASNRNVGNNFYVANNTLSNIKGTYSGVVIQSGTGNSAVNNIWNNSVRTNNSGVSQDSNWYFNTQADGDGSSTKYVCTSNCNIFVNAGAYDFRLNSPTPAGKTLGAPYDVDMNGVKRGSDGTWDRGAFEYGGTAATPSPAPTGTPGATLTPAPTASPTSTPSATPSPSASPSPAPATPTPTPIPTTTSQSLFRGQTPALLNNSDGATVNYELGLQLRSAKAGQIRAIRFFKSPSERGTHVGRIWSSTGTLLASVTFTSETASGWQQQALTTPLTINANNTYVVSVNTGSSYYVATNYALVKAITNGDLTALANGGVYGPVGQRPMSSFKSNNYFRDIVFVPAP